MIHNNMRKLIKKFWGAGVTTTADTNPIDFGYIDIDGHVGTDTDTGARYVNGSVFGAYYVSNYQLPNIFTYNFGSSSSSAFGGVLYYTAIGNSVENEPDYTLGEFLSTDLRYSVSNNKLHELLNTTTIANIGDSDITFNELGFFLHVYTPSSYKWNDTRFINMILIKEQLETAKTIPAHSSIAITFNLLGDVTIE